MWFRRKPKNRRIGHESVLDVKLRSSQVRAARNRVAAVGLGALFATLLGGYLLWCGAGLALNALVYENKAFAIQEFDVQTDGVIDVDQLRRWTGAKLGDNLLALDLARLRRDLELIPMIQSASVERLLPHTLRVRVVERDPIAQINVPRPDPAGGIELAVFLIDAEGYVMLPLEPHERAASAAPADDSLTVLGVANANDVQPGRRIQTPQVQAALQLIPLFERSAMAGLVDVKRVDVSSGDVLTVTTGQGSEVTFGLVDLEQQLRRWREIFNEGQKLNRAIATLDLAVTNSIPVQWLDTAPVPLSQAKPVKPLHQKKKHV